MWWLPLRGELMPSLLSNWSPGLHFCLPKCTPTTCNQGTHSQRDISTPKVNQSRSCLKSSSGLPIQPQPDPKALVSIVIHPILSPPPLPPPSVPPFRHTKLIPTPPPSSSRLPPTPSCLTCNISSLARPPGHHVTLLYLLHRSDQGPMPSLFNFCIFKSLSLFQNLSPSKAGSLFCSSADPHTRSGAGTQQSSVSSHQEIDWLSLRIHTGHMNQTLRWRFVFSWKQELQDP